VSVQARGDVLELAAGSGRNFAYYSREARLTAQDISPVMLGIARTRAAAMGRDVDLVVPLTTQLVDAAEPLRIRIRASGSLKKDSDALIDQVRAIDNRRLVQGPLSRLQPKQLDAVGHALIEVLELAVD
jgi:mRNA-degrading endonuclease toxin of MazEF toxin-antitoxin module